MRHASEETTTPRQFVWMSVCPAMQSRDNPQTVAATEAAYDAAGPALPNDARFPEEPALRCAAG